MIKPIHKILVLSLLTMVAGCETKKSPEDTSTSSQKRTTVEMQTDQGTLVIALYNETPKHRDNFVKLVRSGAYDSLLFHRVIENFMIQGGDPDSRFAKAGDTLGNGGLGYKVDAEFQPNLFHKKGALGAARDGNLQRASSSMQFYIVQGKIFNDSLLDVAEGRINGWLGEHFFKNDPANQAIATALQQAEAEEDMETYYALSDSIRELASGFEKFEKYRIPQEHKEVYKQLGGTPHLDQNYTVFGEVIKGLEVIDKIAASKTNELDRPIEDVRILKVSVLD